MELCNFLHKGVPLDSPLEEIELLPNWANEPVPLEEQIDMPNIEQKDKDPNTAS